MAHESYEVRVAGIVPVQDLRDVGATAMVTESTMTTLYGEIKDDAALYGLLLRLQQLGLEVVEVRRVPAFEQLSGEQPPKAEDSL